MFTASAHFPHTQPNDLGAFEFGAEFTTDEARDAVLATFPKFVKAKASTIGRMVGDEYRTNPTIRFRAAFYAEKGNAANETGAKRVRRFLAIAGAVTWATPYKNSIATLEEALSRLPA